MHTYLRVHLKSWFFFAMSQMDNGVRSVLFHISNLKIFLFFKDSISVVNNTHSQELQCYIHVLAHYYTIYFERDVNYTNDMPVYNIVQ